MELRKALREPLATSSHRRAAGDRGDDGELVVVRDLGLLAVEVADVLVALVDVDERAQLAVTGVEVLLEAWVLGGEATEGFPSGGAANLDLGFAVGVLPQWCGDLELRHI